MSLNENTIYHEGVNEWQDEPITFSQHNQIFHFCCKPMASKFVGKNLYKELKKLNKGQASKIMGLFKGFAGSQALLKLKDFGMPVNITKEDIKN